MVPIVAALPLAAVLPKIAPFAAALLFEVVLPPLPALQELVEPTNSNLSQEVLVILYYAAHSWLIYARSERYFHLRPL